MYEFKVNADYSPDLFIFLPFTKCTALVGLVDLFCSINKFSLIAHRIDTKMDSTKFSAFYSTFVRFVFKFIA